MNLLPPGGSLSPLLVYDEGASYGMQQIIDAGLSAAGHAKTREYITKGVHGVENIAKRIVNLEERGKRHVFDKRTVRSFLYRPSQLSGSR